MNYYDRHDYTAVVRQHRMDLGWEIDLGLNYEIMEGLTYTFAAGVLFTGDSFDYMTSAARTRNGARSGRSTTT